MDVRRYSTAAVVFLVVLRIGIGWQLLYEGMWKIKSLNSPKPWTSAGYLKNSVGPMRNTFRAMAGDPDELGWLDYKTVSTRWQDWAARFKKHYRLTDKQAGSLHRLLHGRQTKMKINGEDREVFAENLAELPPGIDVALLNKTVSEKIFGYNAAEKKIWVDAGRMLAPAEKGKLDKLVAEKTDDASKTWLTTLNKVYDRQKKGMGYLRKLEATVEGDPKLRSDEKWQKVGKIKQYKDRLAEYERDYAAASTPFEHDHLAYTWGKLQTLRSELTGPVKALEYDLQDEATKGILTIEQHQYGAVPKPWSLLRISDILTITGLTILGILLVVGLFSRFASIAAAVMLFSFYLAMPPLPGVPAVAGPEHSLIVNKNLIEVFALLALAFVPTGMWFGLDRLWNIFAGQWKEDNKISKNLKSMVAAGDDPEPAAAT